METILNFGFEGFFKDKKIEKEVGRIIFFGGTSYKIICKDGEKEARLKGSFKKECEVSGSYPTVGDWIGFESQENSSIALIDFLYERKNKISRTDPRLGIELEQIIAANIDTAFICMSLNKDFNLNRLARYVFALQNIETVLLLTKADLSETREDAENLIKKIYPHLKVYCISIFEPDSLENIKHYFKKGKTSVLLGSSGVGKSSLINSLTGKEILRTSEINKKIDKGVHTTTNRQIISLGEDSGVIMDTPGMKVLGIWDSDSGENSFADITELKSKCIFSECTHTCEKGCAVLEALKTGLLDKNRYELYLQLLKEDRRKIRREKRQEKFLIKKEEKSKSAKRRFKEKKNIKQTFKKDLDDLLDE
ncbi:ribosome small subunit-dependent GTPase A [Treponema denticola]|uniref:ribosome small subunit-dependent GTPase A n=1 Tax=Treponema denticola TaxID=158 RepID=UPI0001FD38A0|nr:ribosome small subunit-dependent GTPase A [Treponema denticola]EGC77761.1 GTPase YjeQ [Treponema denticola F0402]